MSDVFDFEYFLGCRVIVIAVGSMYQHVPLCLKSAAAEIAFVFEACFRCRRFCLCHCDVIALEDMLCKRFRHVDLHVNLFFRCIRE